MVDAALIQQCADPGLKPAIVMQFIERAGSLDPLTVTVRSGNRIVLVPRPTTADEALALIRENLGRNTIRVGITQYPAGLGIVDAGQLKPDLVDACQNIRVGTALFAKVYRIVAKWYGNPTGREALPQILEDAIIAWQTGYFEGVAVFRADDSGQIKLAPPTGRKEVEPQPSDGADATSVEASTEAVVVNPNNAGIRVDLSGIGSRP